MHGKAFWNTVRQWVQYTQAIKVELIFTVMIKKRQSNF